VGGYWQERKQQKEHVDSEAKLTTQLDDLRHDMEMMRYFLFLSLVYSLLSVSWRPSQCELTGICVSSKLVS
jgi:hypothetical protein